MSDAAKLKKHAARTAADAARARARLDDAIVEYTAAISAHAVVQEAAEQAEALETALALRGKKME